MSAKLVEPGMKYFTTELLNKCNEKKLYFMNVSYNIGITILFFGFIIILVCISYQDKVYRETNNEYIQLEKEKSTIETLKKIRELEKKYHSELISNIPYHEVTTPYTGHHAHVHTTNAHNTNGLEIYGKQFK